MVTQQRVDAVARGVAAAPKRGRPIRSGVVVSRRTGLVLKSAGPTKSPAGTRRTPSKRAHLCARPPCRRGQLPGTSDGPILAGSGKSPAGTRRTPSKRAHLRARPPRNRGQLPGTSGGPILAGSGKSPAGTRRTPSKRAHLRARPPRNRGQLPGTPGGPILAGSGKSPAGTRRTPSKRAHPRARPPCRRGQLPGTSGGPILAGAGKFPAGSREKTCRGSTSWESIPLAHTPSSVERVAHGKGRAHFWMAGMKTLSLGSKSPSVLGCVVAVASGTGVAVGGNVGIVAPGCGWSSGSGLEAGVGLIGVSL